jgi:surface antigen
MRRIFQRVMLGGLLTNSVGRTLSEPEYNTAITASLRAYVNTDSRIKDLIELREENLVHCPMNLKIKSYQESKF